jgi:hypothetical protein
LILVMPVIGQKLVLPLFVVVYLWWWSEFGWRLIVCALTWAALIVFYDQILHVFSYSAALSDWLPRGRCRHGCRHGFSCDRALPGANVPRAAMS